MPTIKNHQLLEAASQIRIELFEISHGYLDQSWNYKNLRAAFTRIYFPLDGMGKITYGNKTEPLLPGHIYIVPAGLSFSCEGPQHLEKIYIHLNLTHPGGSDVFNGISECLVLKDEDDVAHRLVALECPCDVGSVLTLKSLLYGILDRAFSLSTFCHSPLREYSPTTQNALAYIDSVLSERLGVEEIAAALFISPSVLQKRFREDVGIPIGQFIDNQLMAKAELMLLNNVLSIKEISEKRGFCDQFYFSRRFSAFHGLPPSQFRKMYQV